MDHDETRALLADACDYLPRLAGYVKAASDGGQLIGRAWAAGLEQIDLADASRVLTAIASNELQLPDGFLWEQFPRLIRDEVRNLRYAMSRDARRAAAANRDSTYACGLCLDSGFARIYHPGFARSYVLHASCRNRLAASDPDSREAIRTEHASWKAKAANVGRRLLIAMSAICTCSEGDRHAQQKHLANVISYDANRTAIYRNGTPREILAWIDKRNEPTEWNADDWD